jgi:transcriptional regulator with XRE-family HTH domain
MSFGSRLRELRMKKNVTQEQLAKQLGVFKSAITKYENDVNFPNTEVFIKICHIFDVPSDYLLGITDDRITLKELNKMKEKIYSENPDLLTIIEKTSPQIAGKPITQEQLEYLHSLLDTMKKQLNKRNH